MKWVKRIVVPILVLLLIVYFGVPILVGTSWAKEKVRSAMAESTGREVALGSVSFSWFGGLTVSDVRVDQKAGDTKEEGPLFELASLDLQVGIGDLLAKRIAIDELSIVEPRIVVIRNEDGSFNFSDLMSKPAEVQVEGEPPIEVPAGEVPDAPPPEDVPEKSAGGGGGPDVRAKLLIVGGKLLFIDNKQKTRIDMGSIDAEVNWVNGKLDIDMTCVLNGGQVHLLAEGDLSKTPAPLLVKEFVIDGSELSTEMAQLGYFLPFLGEKPEKASGTLGFEVRDLQATGLDADGLMSSLTAAGKLSLSGGVLASPPVQKLFGSMKEIGVKGLEALGLDESGGAMAIDVLKSSFTIEDGKIKTKDLALDGGGLEIKMVGWTGLDGTINYELALGNLDKVLGSKGKVERFLKDGVLPLSFVGSIGAPEFKFDLEGAVKGRIEEEIEKGLGNALEKGLGKRLPKGLEKGLPKDPEDLPKEIEKGLEKEIEKEVEKGLGGLLGGDDDEEKDKKKRDRKKRNKKNKKKKEAEKQDG